MSARIRIDRGTRHVLVWCKDCPPFRTLKASAYAGHLEAADHAARCHGDAGEAAEHRRRAEELR